MNYIYIIQIREHLGTNIYKIGKTKQEQLARFNQYPKKSKLISQFDCFDCDIVEKNIIDIFKNKYIQQREYGNEYFEGDVMLMKEDIYKEKPINYNTRYKKIIQQLKKITSTNIQSTYFDSHLLYKYIEVKLHNFINDYFNNIYGYRQQYKNVGLYMDIHYKNDVLFVCKNDFLYQKLVDEI